MIVLYLAWLPVLAVGAVVDVALVTGHPRRLARWLRQ